jgi:hypothetical protein
MSRLSEILHPLFEYLSILNTIEEESDIKLTAIAYNRKYQFLFRDEIIHIAYIEGERTIEISYILPEEIERVNHILMPFLLVIGRAKDIEEPKRRMYPIQRSDDVALRLHLVMSGDIYQSSETVFYKNAGTQIATDLLIAQKNL